MQAALISIGDELVLGQTVDTNSAFLSSELSSIGIPTQYHQTIGDDLPAIAEAIRSASNKVSLILVTGGLGPTEDDLTRQALAEAMGVDLVLHEPSLRAIEARMSRRGRTMPLRNRDQAMHPRGSQVIANSCGTAPGIKAKLNNSVIYVAPGVPSELYTMYRESILPELQQVQASRQVILTARVNTFGLGESTVAEQLEGLTDRRRNPLIGTTVQDGIVAIRLRSEFADRERAQAELDRSIELVEQRLGPVVFGRDQTSLGESVVALLKQQCRTVATAESCTGGLVGKMITDVSGSSGVYLGGWVTYSDAMKVQLGIGAPVIAQHGAVSQPVADRLARKALELSGADFGLSITGIAGPQGASDQKPVGTVWIGIARRRRDAVFCDTYLADLPGQRETVRDRAARCGLQLLRFQLVAARCELSFVRRGEDL